MPMPVTFVLVLLFVLALFGAGAWLFRRFTAGRLGTNANRGRMPRLAVIDAAAVDNRRRLVLVRRDNIEHLLMIGGPTDIVVEPNIVRAQPARDQVATRAAVPAPEPTWQEPESVRNEPLDLGEPVALPEPPPPRAPRTAFPDEPRRQPPPPRLPEQRLPEQRPPEPRSRPSDPFAGLTADLPTRSEPPPPRESAPVRESAAVRPAQRSEPLMPRPAARPAEPPPLKTAPPVRAAPERAPAPATADQNLAEMAQRLEAALRRPGEPKADSVDRAPPVAPDAAPSRPARMPAPEPAPVADSGPADAPRAPFKNLEEEMASLLGRPKNST
jgi:flagellar protein FliO/FliZ